MRTAVLRAAGALTLTALLAAPLAAQGPGDLDPAFGTGGVEGLAWPALAYPRIDLVLPLPGGRSLVGGAGVSGNDVVWSVSRRRADGSADPAFGDGGDVRVTWPDAVWTYCAPVAMDRDAAARIWLVGACRLPTNGYRDALAIVRLLPDGRLDSSFDGDGILTRVWIAGQRVWYVHAARLRGDGRLLVAGRNGQGAFLARLLPTGVPDPTFVNGGARLVPFRSATTWGSAEITTLTLDARGRILLGGTFGHGYGHNYGAESVYLVLRLTAAGHLDGSFGAGGRVELRPAYYQTMAGLRALPDERILVAGNHAALYTGKLTCTLFRLSSAGALDRTYGANGFRKVQLNGAGVPAYESSICSALTVDARGGALVAGSALRCAVPGGGCPDSADQELGFRVARLTRTGGTDQAFGALGRTWVPAGDLAFTIHRGLPTALRIDSAGRILMLGSLPYGWSFDQAVLARLLATAEVP